eukprot:1159151-Pelagomonas_calceolata.AAC.3
MLTQPHRPRSAPSLRAHGPHGAPCTPVRPPLRSLSPRHPHHPIAGSWGNRHGRVLQPLLTVPPRHGPHGSGGIGGGGDSVRSVTVGSRSTDSAYSVAVGKRGSAFGSEEMDGGEGGGADAMVGGMRGEECGQVDLVAAVRQLEEQVRSVYEECI